MGIDLKLLPLLYNGCWAAHDILCVERRKDLWPLIQEMPSFEIPNPLACHLALSNDGDSTIYEEIEDDAYGSVLKFTTAGSLSALGTHDSVRYNQTNRAVWAYLSNMHPDHEVVLYWC